MPRDRRERATTAEWERYYARAEQLRSVTGDPLRRHLARVTARERAWLAGASLLFVLILGAFWMLAIQP